MPLKTKNDKRQVSTGLGVINSADNDFGGTTASYDQNSIENRANLMESSIQPQ